MEAKNVSRQVYLHKPAPPCAINCLPIEILAMIFTFVGVSKIPVYSPRNTTFPFNVAATCIFWMEILKSNPENWKSISIDVMDPTPFLDTFSIFTGGPIEVYVFSGARKKASRGSILAGISVEDARKSHENRQTQIIFGQLEPHCKRCVSITFDLVFQSSLPCTTSILARSLPCLEKLVLKCQIHDMDDEDESMDETYIDEDKLEVETPLLKEISLPGYSFMQFGRLSQELRTMIGENLLSLSIDHLTLHKDEIGVHDNIQTFVGFMDGIESLNCNTLNLSNITFGYRPRPRNKEYTFLGRQVSLVNVSAEFISAFFGCVTMDDLSVLHITRSSIPLIFICSSNYGQDFKLSSRPARHTIPRSLFFSASAESTGDSNGRQKHLQCDRIVCIFASLSGQLRRRWRRLF